MNGSNPFALIQGTLHGETIYLRPVQFDSSDYDKNFKKPNGEMIRPTMVQTTCPKCSCVIEQAIAQDFNTTSCLKVNCIRCNPPSNNNVFAFDDPIQMLKIPVINVNPNAASNIRVAPKCKKELEKPVVEQSPLDKLFRPTKPMGLGEFIRSKQAWNKLKHQFDTNFVNKSEDVFDMFSNNLPESNQTGNNQL
jgi:hypothetical protein